MPSDVTAWTSSTATDQGPRQEMADAARTYWNPMNGRLSWAVADGIGDHCDAADAADLAVFEATRVATTAGAAAGITEARTVLRSRYGGEKAPLWLGGDCVMVAAVAMSDRVGGGFEIAWVGDCRAYVIQDGTLRQVTEDHTQAEEWRHSEHEGLRAIADTAEHIVTRSVRSAQPIATVRVLGQVERLMLCTDGLSKYLDAGTIAHILAADASPRWMSRALVAATRRRLRARDNIAVTVLAPRTP